MIEEDKTRRETEKKKECIEKQYTYYGEGKTFLSR
jgi:hypothetical protein